MNDTLQSMTSDHTLNDVLAAAQLLGLGSTDLGSIAKKNVSLIKKLKSFDPIRLASAFGGLLTVPALQSNCFRLETLVHLALASATGNRKPNAKSIASAFSSLGNGICGRLEDPAEDVFVSSIATKRGNFLVLEGIWESAGFYLQRIVNVLESMPEGPGYDPIRETTYALLQLSDLVCKRVQLTRYQLGADLPLDSLSSKLAESAASLGRLLRFSQGDLESNGIAFKALAAFIFDPDQRSQLQSDRIGHSRLERFPVVWRDTKFHFVLPTATSAAIRRYIIERMDAAHMRETFLAALAIEYAKLLSSTPLLGGHGDAPIEFRRTKNGLLAGAMTRADTGRYLSFVFFVDTLEQFETTGLSGTNPDPTIIAADTKRWIDTAYNAARKEPDFRECLCILVGCGIGRGIVNYVTNKDRENWRLEFLSVPNLLTLSWLPDFKPLSVWRILDGQQQLKTIGVEIFNVNGLLNMVAWARSLGGHLVPHGNLPDAFGASDNRNFIVIEQNILRSLRHEVDTYWDVHAVQNTEGRWLRVRKPGESLFKEDQRTPIYVCEERTDGRWPHIVYESAARAWWCEMEVPPDTSGYWAYERAKMLKGWLARAVPVLEGKLVGLPDGPILWHTKFEGSIGDIDGDVDPLNFDQTKAAIAVDVDSAKNVVSLRVSKEFETALFHPENIAERALVLRLIEGVTQLAGQALSHNHLDECLAAIVPDVMARHAHAFRARRFRDFVRESVPRTPITIDADDAAALKLGLGWRVRNRNRGGDIYGKEECTTFLNDVVALLEDDLCSDLQRYDRSALIGLALRNHESAANDRDQWNRTAGAVLSLHKNREETLHAIAEHQGKLNAVFQATRLLIEFALCESPLKGGMKPGRLDLSRLMVKASSILGLGGWSDAIHWDAMDPRLRVTPLGDIHASQEFHDSIIAPFGRAGSDVTVEESVRNYAVNLDEVEIRPTVGDTLDRLFLDAWQEEFGASLDDMRKFVDFVEDIGLRKSQAIFKVPKSHLLDVKISGATLAPETAENIVDALTLRSRPRWRDIPEGYNEKDRQPWRFRRRLTVLRKPLIQLDHNVDPTIIVAPGILRDALTYMIGNYHRGDFPRWQLKPAMHSWAGKSRGKIGHEFNQAVASRLKELGWLVEQEIAITKLLRMGFDRVYGDVDVLAWRPENGRVLVIECKDVQFRKTYGEIAEQLADYRGEVRDGKPDLLLRHLNRIEIIAQNLTLLVKFLGISQAPQMEGHLVFKNPVPMKFAWTRMAQRVALHTFAELNKI